RSGALLTYAERGSLSRARPRRTCRPLRRACAAYAMADHATGKSGINSAICRESLSQLFGREAERTRIEELLARASGGPVGIALEGAPGIGKTTVWRDATERARVLGYRVLVAAPSEPDRTLAFAGVGDLFESLGDELFDRLPDPQRRALRAALFLD